MIDVDCLKCDGQKPRLIQTFTILTKFEIHLSLDIKILR